MLGLFFTMMLVVYRTSLQRAGAAIGLASAVYLVFVGVRVARWPLDQGATCVRAYKLQLDDGGWPTWARPRRSCCR